MARHITRARSTKPDGKIVLMLEERYTMAEVIQRLDRFGGLVKPTARSLGCSRSVLNDYLNRNPAAKAAARENVETLIDDAELFVADIIRGKIACDVKSRLAAAQYILSTVGKSRGYTTRTETEVTGGVDLPGFTFRKKRPEEA